MFEIFISNNQSIYEFLCNLEWIKKFDNKKVKMSMKGKGKKNEKIRGTRLWMAIKSISRIN